MKEIGALPRVGLARDPKNGVVDAVVDRADLRVGQIEGARDLFGAEPRHRDRLRQARSKAPPFEDPPSLGDLESDAFAYAARQLRGGQRKGAHTVHRADDGRYAPPVRTRPPHEAEQYARHLRETESRIPDEIAAGRHRTLEGKRKHLDIRGLERREDVLAVAAETERLVAPFEHGNLHRGAHQPGNDRPRSASSRSTSGRSTSTRRAWSSSDSGARGSSAALA